MAGLKQPILPAVPFQKAAKQVIEIVALLPCKLRRHGSGSQRLSALFPLAEEEKMKGQVFDHVYGLFES